MNRPVNEAMMKVQWCWRCKMNLPMLDEDEFTALSARSQSAPLPEKRQVLLDEYGRLTGYKETVFNAVLHHRICMYGPPCPQCGKVLRTPVAYKCFECGYVVHEPNWSFLFTIADVGQIKGRGTTLVTAVKNIQGKLNVGDLVEVWDLGRRVFRTTVREILQPHDLAPDVRNIALLFLPDIPRKLLVAGQKVQLAQSHCISQREKPILDYDPARPDRLLMRRSAVHVAVLIDVLLAAIFAVTRQIQLRQPDSYNNVWTDISTFALLTGVALWAVLVVAAVNLRRHGKTLNSFAYIWLTIAGIPVAVGIVRMLLFVFGR